MIYSLFARIIHVCSRYLFKICMGGYSLACETNLLFFSLNNYSENIRWSLDLRWQVPDKPNGFYGLKVFVQHSWFAIDRSRYNRQCR